MEEEGGEEEVEDELSDRELEQLVRRTFRSQTRH